MDIKPVFKITNRHVKLIDEISSLRERILNSKLSVAWKPALQREAVIKNAMGSTAIEGYALSLPEVEALSRKKAPGADFSENEIAVFNYLAALKFISKTYRRELDNDYIRALHAVTVKGMLKDDVSGKYRKVQNYVVTGTGQIMYKPPLPAEVPGLMDDLIAWANHGSAEFLPVISSAILHYTFVSIHPFVDGNGRVARLLAARELLRRNFDTQHIFAIDDIIYEHRGAYYAALKSAQDNKGDITHWVEYYLEVIAESLERAWKRVESLPGTRKNSTPLELTPKQEKTLTLLHSVDRLSARELAGTLHVSVQGVHFILGPLIKAKMVKRFGGWKTGKFGLAK